MTIRDEGSSYVPSKPGTAGTGRTHGTRSTYRAGCREECCRSAERLYKRQYRKAKAS